LRGYCVGQIQLAFTVLASPLAHAYVSSTHRPPETAGMTPGVHFDPDTLVAVPAAPVALHPFAVSVSQ
jgi:hypothetical protein